MLERGIDLVICVAILALAIRLVSGQDLFRSIVLFIAMGLMLALAWVRLAAPDIALAEAAIGAGLTGVLLIRAGQGQRMRGTVAAVAGAVSGGGPRRVVATAGSVGITAVFAVVMVFAVMGLPTEPNGLTGVAAANMEASGVDHAVTAVLLNFRAYDTWLEIGVLLLAILGVLAIHRRYDCGGMRVEAPTMRVLSWLARVILPLAILTAGYLYWAGTHIPGGAFQAGAVVAAALVLLALAGSRGVAALRALPLAALLVLSFAAFLAVSIVASTGNGMLHYRDGTAGLLILGLELTIVISTAVTLAALFAGAGPRAGAGEPRRDAATERPKTL